jgi:threonine dehydrogenase-like Zn-dependent dehydrogenase
MKNMVLIMKKTMKALRTYAPHDMRIEEVPMPVLSDGEILIKVRGCGICAGDIKMLNGGIRIWGATENRFIQPPVISGHEFFGEVVDFDSNVKDVAIGDLLISEQIIPCGECRFCREGSYWMCQNRSFYGLRTDAQGGFAEYMKFHKKGLNHKIPKNFTIEQGVLIEPLSCGMHAVDRGKIGHNDIVVISGMGAIGLGMVAVARAQMPKMIIGLDLRQNRLELGIKYGADITLNPLETDVIKKINELTDGYGCDVYIEASGSAKSVQQGLAAVRKLGRMVEFGVFGNEVTADWNIIGDAKEIDILGSHLGPYCYDAVIQEIAKGSIPTEGLITHQFPLEQWEKAFEIAEKDTSAIKVALIP